MSLPLVRGAGSPLLHRPQDTPQDVLADWIGRLKPGTLRAFRCDLARFGEWLGVKSDGELLFHLREAGAARTETVVAAFLRSEAERGLAPSTVTGRLTAIRSLLKLARKQKLIEWTIEVDLPERARAKVRDMSGPSREEMLRLIAHVEASAADDRELALRDHACVALLYGAALRVEEAVSLDLEHVTPKGEIWVRGKGRGVREAHPALAPWVLESVQTWIAVRPRCETQALLLSYAEPRDQTARARLSQRAARSRLEDLAKRAGIESPVRPHGLRHACATHMLEAGADMHAVSTLLRHASVATTMDHYADGGRKAAANAALLLTPPKRSSS